GWYQAMATLDFERSGINRIAGARRMLDDLVALAATKTIHFGATQRTQLADLADNGVEGTGRTSVEHITPQSDDPAQANVYRNCLYACNLCNRARSTKPLQDDKGNRLLDPTCEGWASHFEARENKLVRRTGHGEYTRDAYDLNSPRKVYMRSERRERIARWCKLLREGPAQAAALADLAGQLAVAADTTAAARAELLLQASAERIEDIRLARKWLERYQGTPSDADSVCRCRIALALPEQIAAQLIDV
ncbi:MAG: hypothetical protein ACMG6S_05830, partial [Byssovorax sp.]